METGAVEFTNPIVLVRPPFRVSFAFAGRDRVWKDSWQNVKQLPNAVRVTVRNASTGEILPVSTATLIKGERAGRMRAEHRRRVRRSIKALVKSPGSRNGISNERRSIDKVKAHSKGMETESGANEANRANMALFAQPWN